MNHKTKLQLLIVNRARKFREEGGFSQRQVAEFLGVSAGFIGQVESDNSASAYSMEQINDLAILFKCTLHDLIPKQPTR